MIKKLIKQLEEAIDKEGLIELKEAAEIRGTTVSAISQLISRGRLSAENVLGRTLVYREEVEGFVKEQPGPALGTIFNK